MCIKQQTNDNVGLIIGATGATDLHNRLNVLTIFLSTSARFSRSVGRMPSISLELSGSETLWLGESVDCSGHCSPEFPLVGEYTKIRLLINNSKVYFAHVPAAYQKKTRNNVANEGDRSFDLQKALVCNSVR